MPISKLDELLARKRREFGAKFSPDCLDSRFAKFYGTDQRIMVKDFGEIRYGRVGITTGWRPVFLLMHSSRSIGSAITLTERTELLAVKVGRCYVPCDGTRGAL